MGSNGSKASSSCSSSTTSSSSGSFRKGRSKKKCLGGFQFYCLGTTLGSHDSDSEDQVCDQVKVNGSVITYTNGNETDSDEVKRESFRKVKASDMTSMPSNIDLDEWGERSILNTSSGTVTSSVHDSSTHSLNPTSHCLSRFSLVPDNVSFRLSRTTSLGSSTHCPVSSASLSMFNNEDGHNVHTGRPSGSLINKNDTKQCSHLLPMSFVNKIPTQCHEGASNNLRSNAPASALPDNLQTNPTGGVGARERSDVSLFSPRIQTETENFETRHIDHEM